MPKINERSPLILGILPDPCLPGVALEGRSLGRLGLPPFITYLQDTTLEPISKKRVLFQIKAEPSINPQEYLRVSRT